MPNSSSPLPSVFRTLEDELYKRKAVHERHRRVHCDSGMAIDLRYDPQFYVANAPPRYHSVASSLSANLLAGVFDNTGYTVESFEADDAGGAAFGTGELEDAAEGEGGGGTQLYSAQPGRSPGTGSGGGTTLFRAASLAYSQSDDERVWGTAELESLEGPVSASLSNDADARVWGTAELQDMEANASGTDAAQPATEAAAASAVQPSVADLAQSTFTQLAQSEDVETRAFANDIRAILSGQKSHPSSAPGLPPTPPAEDEELPPPPPAMPHTTSFTHADFDRMGEVSDRLSTAQTFNLGNFNLSRQFDVFDTAMDMAEQHSTARMATTTAPTTTPHQEFLEDMSYARTSVPTPAPAPLVAQQSGQSVSLRFTVPLVPQQTGMSCWAAGAAMVVGWRDQMSVDPSEVARAAGAWAQYQSGLAAEDTSIFPVWGLEPETAQSYTVDAFYSLLDRFGPLWVAAAVPGPHIRVVTGLEGDGTPDGTTLYINDPWPVGQGAQYTETYTQFVARQETLARQEIKVQGIYIAHARGARSHS